MVRPTYTARSTVTQVLAPAPGILWVPAASRAHPDGGPAGRRRRAVAAATQFLATRKDPDLFFAALAYISYAGALLAAVAAYALARYEDVPDPRGLVRLCVDRTKVETLAHLVAARVKVYEANFKKHRRKVLLWWVSVVALVLG